MKKWALLGATLLSTAVFADEKLSCVYSVMGVPEPEYLPMRIFGKTEVNFDGTSFTALREDGSYVVTPILADKQGELYLDDITRIISVSRDRTRFAISHRITQIVEYWDECQKVVD